MQTIKLNNQKEEQLFPSQLDFLQILSLRGSAYFSEEKKLYKSLKAGYEGEQKVVDYIQTYGHSEWIILQNIWLKEFSRFECDMILITSQTIYVFEVKNYKGIFRYDNGRCYYDFNETQLNPIEQLRQNLVSLRKICSKVSPRLTIKGAVIFAGEDHEVQINQGPTDIDIITSNGIRNYILKLAKENSKTSPLTMHTDKIIQSFNHYEAPNLYRPKPLTSDEMKEITAGIHCINCHSFKMQITQKEVICVCGQRESREEATVRTICDYGVLNYETELSRGQLLSFFNHQLSRFFLQKVLNKHFDVVPKGRYTYYLNQKLPYKKMKYQLNNP